MVTLTPDDRQRIAEAVADAETKTSGEVCCVLTEEASDYREVPLTWAALAALVLPPLGLAFGLRPLTLSQMVSGWAAEQSADAAREVFLALGSYAITQVILFAVVALVVSIPAVRRLMTPSFVKRHRVRRMARHHFAALVARLAEGAYAMIYVSHLDRMVEIVVSESAGKACDAAAWHKATAALGDALGRDRAGEGFVAAIAICGGELAKHCPPGEAHENRLPDTLIEE
jgi:putative membrane protein